MLRSHSEDHSPPFLTIWNCQVPMRGGPRQPQALVWKGLQAWGQILALPSFVTLDKSLCLRFLICPKKVIIEPVWENCHGDQMRVI